MGLAMLWLVLWLVLTASLATFPDLCCICLIGPLTWDALSSLLQPADPCSSFRSLILISCPEHVAVSLS